MTVRVQTADFDAGAEIARLRAGDARVGAVASFIGTVRDRNDGQGVSEMELEHYPGMTERAIESTGQIQGIVTRIRAGVTSTVSATHLKPTQQPEYRDIAQPCRPRSSSWPRSRQDHVGSPATSPTSCAPPWPP